MMRQLQRASFAGAAFVVAMPALAQVSGALDRVPENAAVVVTMRNLAEFHQDIGNFAHTFGVHDMLGAMEVMGTLLDSPGLNAAGSAAIAILPDPDGAVDFDAMVPPVVVVLPVTNFTAFVESLGGAAGPGVVGVDLMGETAFMKDLGGGYAALSPMEDLLNHVGAAGAGRIHERRLGEIGASLARTNDLLIAVDVRAFASQIEEAMHDIADSFEMMAMMMGDQAAGMEQFGQMLVGMGRTLLDDGQVVLMGVNVDAAGLTLDFGAQFREASDMGVSLGHGGNADRLFASAPDMNFLFAMAMDMSSPSIKRMFSDMAEMSMRMNPDQQAMFGFMNIGQMMDLQDGQMMLLGDPPALMMGGLLSQCVQVTFSKDSAALRSATADISRKMNGTSSGGITFNTSYTENATTVNGVAVDSWSMRMTPDPENEQGSTINMALGMIFGPNMGPGGYHASVDGGLITTYSANSALMGQTIRTMREGGGLAANETFRSVAAHLPEGSFIQLYVGVGNLMRQASSAMAMMGGGFDIDVPANLPPAAMAVAARSGGLQMRLFVPQGVLDMVNDLRSGMFDGDDWWDEDDDDRF